MTKTKTPLRDKSFAFSIRIVGASQYLDNKYRAYVLSKQLLRSGTAISALYHEAEHAQSKKDFVNKLSIAQKEANETLYWLRLLEAKGLFTKKQFQSLYNDCDELMRLVTSSIKTAKK